MSYQTPLEMLYQWEEQTPDKVYLRQPVDGKWQTLTWKEAAGEIRRMATALKAMHLPLHSNIGLLSKNCAHWIICDLAIMMAGHVSVPLYPNLAAETIRQVLDHCGAPLLFVGKLDDFPSMKPGIPDQVQCISFPFYGPPEYPHWGDLIRKYEPLSGNPNRDPGEPGTIIYTSGSTGKPKGVMHKIGNFSFCGTQVRDFASITNADRCFSYLPMAHIGERLVVEVTGLYGGAEISFAESLHTFMQNLQESSPTVFLGVHRIWKKFQEGVHEKIPERKLNLLLKLPIVSALIKKRIRRALGLHHARHVITAAAPTPVELQIWFRRLGIKLVEGYSMTENFGYSHGILWPESKPGTVGKPLPGCEVKLGEDDEVLVRHPALMDGYFKDPQLTRETFTDGGYLKTGDRGIIDADGYLKITGRTKDIFKTSKAKYVVPSPIEMKFGRQSDIAFCCVVGAGMPQPITLVTLTEIGKLKPDALLVKEFEALRTGINETLDPHEKIEKLVILREDWTPDNNMLTPTFKIRRSEIEKKYAESIEGWYSQPGTCIWG
jgi:long-subunit acyl-CoA synthetase (AMP-forming)